MDYLLTKFSEIFFYFFLILSLEYYTLVYLKPEILLDFFTKPENYLFAKINKPSATKLL
jgi:hypothetical protein